MRAWRGSMPRRGPKERHMNNGKFKEHDPVRLKSGKCGVVEAERGRANIQEWEVQVRVYDGDNVTADWHRVSEVARAEPMSASPRHRALAHKLLRMAAYANAADLIADALSDAEREGRESALAGHRAT